MKLGKGKVIGKRWRILKRIGEGGFGAVYKVENIDTNELAALKAEWNRGPRSVLRLEAMILRRLEGKTHFAQLLQTGKKTSYSYIVMTLLGESLDTVLKKIGRICTISTQIRVGINALYEIKQLHDVGFITPRSQAGEIWPLALAELRTSASFISSISDWLVSTSWSTLMDGQKCEDHERGLISEEPYDIALSTPKKEESKVGPTTCGVCSTS
ncbi:hypothetical protein COOONC_13077 [Cooperia oncophora]